MHTTLHEKLYVQQQGKRKVYIGLWIKSLQNIQRWYWNE